MDAVDLVQGVLGIRQSLGLARWVNLAREAETLDQEGMGIVAVVDKPRAIGDMAGEGFRRPPLGWLRAPFRDDNERLSVGRDAYGDHVPGYPAKALPVLPDPLGLVHRDKRLIEPYPAGEDDAVLASIEASAGVSFRCFSEYHSETVKSISSSAGEWPLPSFLGYDFKEPAQLGSRLFMFGGSLAPGAG